MQSNVCSSATYGPDSQAYTYNGCTFANTSTKLPEPFSDGSLMGLMPVENPHFTGRQKMLASISEGLANAKQGIITQSIVGLGGVGKTQLAAAYVVCVRGITGCVI